MNTDFVLGVIGLAGGLLCAVADILLDLKGPGNVKIGKHKLIDSNWTKMSVRRFSWSVAVAAVAVPMYYMGIVAMKNQLAAANSLLVNIFWIAGTAGAIGGLFIHATLCYCPLIYKRLAKENQAELAEQIIESLYGVVKIPLMVMFTLLTIVTSVVIIIAIFKGWLAVPVCFAALNPLALTITGVALRKIFPRACSDLPVSVCPASAWR